MLSSGLKIDLVHVCTPPSCHAEIAIHSMNAGISVLVEKPMAPSLKECDEMLEAEKKKPCDHGLYRSEPFPEISYIS